MSQPVAEWNSPLLSGTEGVIVGCNSSQEWLLPWWYMNFRLHNTYPVTFVNFGDMSAMAVAWCRQRGSVVELDCGEDFIAGKESVDPELAAEWKRRRAKIWLLRKAWFKVPFALLKSPYQKTVWTDLDCQVTGSIAPIFSQYLNKTDFAVVQEAEKEQAVYQSRGDLVPGEIIYNSGVVAYRHGSKVIQEWAAIAANQSNQYMGCQKILARLLLQNKHPFTVMPDIYNWAMVNGENQQAVILHYWGACQQVLPKRIAFLKQKMFMDLTIPE